MAVRLPEVIDLRSLWPWDQDCAFTSVRKTGRLLVAAEVALTVAEELGTALKAPVKRIGAPRMPVPYAPTLEGEYRVTDTQSSPL